jgi:predicted metal-dependent enzyme (double-stranded beta helix superfamily)
MVMGTPANGFATYLLSAAPPFVVFMIICAPDVVTPIHDHGGWGLVGLYQGVEEEVRYRMEPGARGTRTGGLHEVGRMRYSSGDVMHIEPPPNDIHQVFNRGVERSITINVFPFDLVRSGFHVYQAPDFLPLPTGPLQYDPSPALR